MRLGVVDHLLDLVLGQTGATLDLDPLFLAGLLVLGADVDDAVGVDVEADLDLRHATRRRLDAGQVELAQRLVVQRLLALTLQHMHGDRRLVVFRSREGLRCLGRNRGVLLDDLGKNAAHGLDAEGKRGHVEQQHVLDVASQHAALNRGTNGHGLIRVHVLLRLLAEELGDGLLHLGHAGLATDQDHVGHVGDAQTGIVQRRTARLDGALDQVLDQRLEFGAGQLDGQVLRTTGIRRDVRQVDLGLLAAGQLDLGALGGITQALQRQRILAQVHALVLLELLDQVVDDTLVEILTTEESVAVGGQHFELLLAIDFGDLDDRHVKGTAAEVVDRDLAITALLVEAVRKCCRSRLVDDALYFQTGDLAGVLGGLALAVVEVGRHGDDRFGDLLAEVVFGGFLHLRQHFRGNLRRRHLLAVGRRHPGVAVFVIDDGVRHQIDVLLHLGISELATNEALHRVEGVLGVGDRLTLGGSANQRLAVLGKGDGGWRGAIAFRVFNDLGLAAVHDGDTGVGGTQVDTDDLRHVGFSRRYGRF